MATDSLAASIGALERELERNRAVAARTPGSLADVERQIEALQRRHERLAAEGERARRVVETLESALAGLRELTGDEGPAERNGSEGATTRTVGVARVDRTANHDVVRAAVEEVMGAPVTLAEIEAVTRLSRDDVLASVAYLKSHHLIETPRRKRGIYVAVCEQARAPAIAQEVLTSPEEWAGEPVDAAPAESEEVNPDDVIDRHPLSVYVPAAEDDEADDQDDHELARAMAHVGSELPQG